LELSNNQQKVAIKIDEELCSSCAICAAACPFEAIKKDTETGKMLLEIGKCQVCSICYSSCPAGAIDVVYYDLDSLADYLTKAQQKYKSDSLLIMCKGCAPDFQDVEKLFGISESIPLSVPCVGRVPVELFLKAIIMGIKSINILACDDDYCQFEQGSLLAGRRAMVFNLLLEQLGYGKDVIKLKRNSLKVKVDREKCIACGNCAFYCPYDAAKLESGAATFDLELCRGCGLCVTLCPAFALDLEHWEEDRISALISKLSADMKAPKVLIFRCQWATFPPLGEEEFDSNVRVIDLPCAARVDPLHIVEAFASGIDGVLVVACLEEDCKSKVGSKEAQKSVTALRKTLSHIGFEERLHFCSIAPRYPETFYEELRQFRERIENDYSKEAKQ